MVRKRAKTQSAGPFTIIDAMYQKYIGELSPGIQVLIRGFVLVLIAVAGGAFLLGLGIFAF